MGRANPILHIVVEDKWRQHEKILALQAKGHVIYALTDWANSIPAGGRPRPDLWLLEHGHNWNDVDWDYLEAALATARARRKRK